MRHYKSMASRSDDIQPEEILHRAEMGEKDAVSSQALAGRALGGKQRERDLLTFNRSCFYTEIIEGMPVVRQKGTGKKQGKKPEWGTGA